MAFAPTGRSTTDSPTFTWPAVSSAHHYIFYLSQFQTSAFATLTSATVDPGNTGTCAFTPTSSMAGVSNPPWPVPLSRGHCAGWWIEAYTSSGALISNPPELMFYVPTVITSTSDFGGSYIDAFDPVPVTQWFYVSDFIGQSRRIIDTSVGSGTTNLGFQVFHENLWIPVDISDLVPAAATVAKVSMEIISSCTNGDMIGWSTRRNGSPILNIPAAPLRYVVAPKGDLRQAVEFTVLLNNGKFDFLWSHVVNGIDYAAVNASTVTGRALNASLVAYGMP